MTKVGDTVCFSIDYSADEKPLTGTDEAPVTNLRVAPRSTTSTTTQRGAFRSPEPAGPTAVQPSHFAPQHFCRVNSRLERESDYR